MQALKLNNIYITDIRVDLATQSLIDSFPSLNKKLISFISKFMKQDWGIVSDKDKTINDIMCMTTNYSGVIGIYRFKSYLIQLALDPQNSILFIDLVGKNRRKEHVEIIRLFENIKI